MGDNPYRIFAYGRPVSSKEKKRPLSLCERIEEFDNRKPRKSRKKTNVCHTSEWKRLRLKILERDGGRCVCCGISGVVMHVDHIKPKSRYPELALDPENLQVLCRVCNFSKNTIHETNYRSV